MEWNVSATTDKRFTFFFCNFITFNFSIYKRFLKFLHLAISFQIKKKNHSSYTNYSIPYGNNAKRQNKKQA